MTMCVLRLFYYFRYSITHLNGGHNSVTRRRSTRIFELTFAARETKMNESSITQFLFFFFYFPQFEIAVPFGRSISY